jgi:hypothetical protein
MENKGFDESLDSIQADKKSIYKYLKLKVIPNFNRKKCQASLITSYSNNSTSLIEIETDNNNNTDINEIHSDEELKQDSIYSPSELDFEIAAQLIKDAILGTDIDFKCNRLCFK